MDPRAALLALALLGLSLLLAPPSDGAGPTYVAGEVSGVWTPEGSPYVVIGDAVVPGGLVLEIRAGVEVRVDRAQGLTVFGGLRVLGTPDARVRFTANGTGVPGSWRGIAAVGSEELAVANAVVEYAEAALSVSGGSAAVAGTSLTMGFRGLVALAANATLRDVSLSENKEAGVLAREATLNLRDGLVVGNQVGLSLNATEALVENTSFAGSVSADLVLDRGSVARLRTSPPEAPLKVLDIASTVDVEGLLSVFVTDAFGAPLAGAAVLVEDNGNGTAAIRARSDREGRVPAVVVLERRVLKARAVDFNPFRVTAEADGAHTSGDVVVHGVADLTLAVPVDRTPPTPVAPRSFLVDEDVAVAFDASASTDNDPNFSTTGTFRWSFPEIGIVLTGVHVSYTFATPQVYQGALTVADAAGNQAVLTFLVRVRDRTPPTFGDLRIPERALTAQQLTFEAAAVDNDPTFATTGDLLWRFTLGSTTIERHGARVEVAFPRAGAWSVTVTATDAGGNAVAVERTVVIAAPPPAPSPLPVVGGAAALLAAALGLATERGKVGFLTLLLPLYTRIKDEAVLDQFTRGQIYGYIRVHPGDTYTDIKRNLGLNNGTLTYHLEVLGREGLVRSVTRGARKMFYPVEMRPADDGGGLHDLQTRMLRVFAEAPGAAVADVAAVLGVSRQLAVYHVRLLARKRLVRLERRGLKLCGFAVGPQP